MRLLPCLLLGLVACHAVASASRAQDRAGQPPREQIESRQGAQPAPDRNNNDNRLQALESRVLKLEKHAAAIRASLHDLVKERAAARREAQAPEINRVRARLAQTVSALEEARAAGQDDRAAALEQEMLQLRRQLAERLRKQAVAPARTTAANRQPSQEPQRPALRLTAPARRGQDNARQGRADAEPTQPSEKPSRQSEQQEPARRRTTQPTRAAITVNLRAARLRQIDAAVDALRALGRQADAEQLAAVANELRTETPRPNQTPESGLPRRQDNPRPQDNPPAAATDRTRREQAPLPIPAEQQFKVLRMARLALIEADRPDDVQVVEQAINRLASEQETGIPIPQQLKLLRTAAESWRDLGHDDKAESIQQLIRTLENSRRRRPTAGPKDSPPPNN